MTSESDYCIDERPVEIGQVVKRLAGGSVVYVGRDLARHSTCNDADNYDRGYDRGQQFPGGHSSSSTHMSLSASSSVK